VDLPTLRMVFGNPSVQLIRGIIRKRDPHDFPRINTLIEKVAYPVYDRTGLSGPRPRDNETIIFRIRNDLALVFIKLYIRHTDNSGILWK
jgi:hypothetical protein